MNLKNSLFFKDRKSTAHDSLKVFDINTTGPGVMSFGV